jgi:single-strand DNA-binding protein
MIFNFTFEGNIGNDPQLHFSQSGTAVCNLTVLRTARFFRDGKWVDGQTVAINVTFWRGLAERAAELKRGDTVIVEIADDLHGETYNGRVTLRATGRSLGVSMRWYGATSHRQPKPAPDGNVQMPATGGYDTAADNGYDPATGEVTDEAPAPVEAPATTKPTRTRRPVAAVRS